MMHFPENKSERSRSLPPQRISGMVPDLVAVEVTQEEKDLLDGRWMVFLQNPSSALTVDQFMKALNAVRA